MLTKSGIFLVAVLVCAAAMAASGVRKVAPAQVPYYWQIANTSVNAMVPNSGANAHQPTCVSVRYVIGADGATHDVTLGKAVPSDSGLEPTAVGMVKQFRYAATSRNTAQEPIATFYTVQFNLRDKSAAERRRRTAACDLAGYGVPHAASFSVQ